MTVTRKKLDSTRFKASPDFYKVVFDNMLSGLSYCQMLYDKDGTAVDFKYLKVNKNFEVIAGIKNVEGKKVSELIPGFQKTNMNLIERYAQVAKTGVPERFEVFVQQTNKWNLVSAFSIKKNYFYTLRIDITDFKQERKDLEEAQIAALNVLDDLNIEKERVEADKAKEEAILQAIGDGLIVTDEHEKIILVNAAALRTLGRKSHELLGKTLTDVVPVEDEKCEEIPSALRPITLALKEGKSTTTTSASGTKYSFKRSDKTRFPIAVTVTPINFKKKVTGAIEVFRDVTHERDIDKAKTEFVSLASHQLRTPLSSVRWYTEMLLDEDVGQVNEKQKQYLHEVEHGNIRMINLVNLLLNVSRLELGTTQVHLESITLALVITMALKELEVRRLERNITVEVTIPETLPQIMTDSSLVYIVIDNLLSNAIKYSKEDGFVRVDAREVLSGETFFSKVAHEPCVGLTVEDRGIGIPQEQRDKIFNKLFRADNARSMDVDGSGLGLYLTRLVLQRIKGQIWFTSKLGEGTTMYVLIPLLYKTDL